MGKVLGFENPWDIPEEPSGKGKRKKFGNQDLEDVLKEKQEKIFEFFGASKKKAGSSNSGRNYTFRFAFVILAAILLLWLSTGIFTVDTKEIGVVMRFGKYHRTVSEGLSYKLPLPIESVEKINVTTIRKDVIGKITNPLSTSKYSVKKHGGGNDDQSLSYPKESQMLTADENIIDMHFYVQWVIKNAKDYLFNINQNNNDHIVRSAAESIMREVIGTVEMSRALSDQRLYIEQKTKEYLQKVLDSYKSGIEVVSIGIEYNYVAPEVKDAYWDVQSAKADRERKINDAMAYRNELLPKAKGSAQAILEEAEGYRHTIISKAKGESTRFNQVYSQYIKAKDVTKRRIYLETMEAILKDAEKTIAGAEIGRRILPYLPLTKDVK